MRYLIFVFCAILLTSCKDKEDLKNPNWLVGDWIRTNNQPDHITYETWKLNLKHNLVGIGYTLKDKDTTFKENLSIIIKNDSLFLEVIGVNETPTLFKFIKQTDTSFVCENKSNEFPKKISYYKSNDYLNAVASNDDFKLDFFFNRKSN